MDLPFQFRLRDIFSMTVAMAVGLSCLRLLTSAVRLQMDGLVCVAMLGAVAAFCAAGGAIFGHPWRGGAIGACVMLLLFGAVSLTSEEMRIGWVLLVAVGLIFAAQTFLLKIFRP
jgi:hypothetical protein